MKKISNESLNLLKFLRSKMLQKGHSIGGIEGEILPSFICSYAYLDE